MEEEQFFPDASTSEDSIITFMRTNHWHDAQESELPETKKNFRRSWIIESESQFIWSPRNRKERRELIDRVLLKKLGKITFEHYKSSPTSTFSGIMSRYSQIVAHKLSLIKLDRDKEVTDEELQIAESCVPSSPEELWFIKNGVKAKNEDKIPATFGRPELNQLLRDIKDTIETCNSR